MSVNNVKYIKVKKSGTLPYRLGDIIALREIDKKKYIRFKSSDKDTLLYDFNLKIGDTLAGKVFVLNQFIVAKIDTISLNGSIRKRYGLSYLMNSPGSIGPYLIEGIGCTCGFIPYPLIHEYSGALGCHSVNDKRLYGGSEGKCLLLSNKNPQIELAKIKISPNPVIDMAQIDIPNDVAVDNIKVYDYLGRLIYTTTINQNSVTISAKDYATGMYFVHIYNKQTLVGISKFVVEK